MSDPHHPGHLQRSLWPPQPLHTRWPESLWWPHLCPCVTQAWPSSGPHPAHSGDGCHDLGSLLLLGSRARATAGQLDGRLVWENAAHPSDRPSLITMAARRARSLLRTKGGKPAPPRGPAARPSLDNWKSLPVESVNLYPDA